MIVIGKEVVAKAGRVASKILGVMAHDTKKATDQDQTGEDVQEVVSKYSAWQLHSTHQEKPELSEVDELQQSLSLVRATLESTADGILMISREGKIIDWNEKFIEMWNMPLELLEAGDEEVCLKFVLDQVVDPEDLFKEVTKLYDNPKERANLGELQFKDGRVFERYSQPHRLNGEIVGRVWSFRDITKRRRAEDALRLHERAIEASSHGVVILETQHVKNQIVYVNNAFEKLTGYCLDEVQRDSLDFIFQENAKQEALQKIEYAINNQCEEEFVLQSCRKNGTVFWNELRLAPVPNTSDEVTHFVVIINDITDRRRMEEQLIEQATHDTLTGLPNRALLLDRVEQTIIRAKRSGKKAALLFLDIDQFKLINDSLGHSIGDALLQKVAERLNACARENDTIARIGGDEFVFLLTGLQCEEDSVIRAQQILSAVSQSFHFDDYCLNVTASIGLSFYPKDGENFETLMRNADLSMYHAKDAGRNNFKVYDKEMNERVNRRVQIENKLRMDTSMKDFHLVYQPIVDMKTQSISAFEALLRWQPEGEFIPPDEFIPVAEETGLIISMGEWVIRNAARQVKAWHKLGFDMLRVAINFSPRQFKKGNLVEVIAKIIEEEGIPPECLEVEVTETILIENVEETTKTLSKLKAMGLTIAIDDFGTGYSSLNYLRQFKVDILKIDRSFISDVHPEGDGGAITKAIIELGHSLGLKVLAEGIETPFQYDYLKDNHCDYGQGYLMHKPQKSAYWTKHLSDLKSYAS